MGKPVRDLTGQIFGKLTIIERGESNKHGSSRWICQCECGNRKLVATPELVRGKAKSCGCSQGKKAQSEYGIRHGTKLYDAWRNIRKRCGKVDDKNYANYGGRGIYVADEWQDFLTFARDMGEAPTAAHTIERVDNDGPYAPWNCVWATRLEQAQNKRPKDWGGANNNNARLTVEAVHFIRASDLKGVELAAMFGVTATNISDIRKRKTWKDV